MAKKKIVPPVIETFWILTDGYVYVDGTNNLTLDMHEAYRWRGSDIESYMRSAFAKLDPVARKTLKAYRVEARAKIFEDEAVTTKIREPVK